MIYVVESVAKIVFAGSSLKTGRNLNWPVQTEGKPDSAYSGYIRCRCKNYISKYL